MNRYFTLLQLSIFLSCISLSAISQTTGDYRSKSSGDWSLSATWERYDGANWVNAPGPASSADGIITIRSAHTILVTDTRTADQLIVDAGATLNITSTLTVDDGTGTDMTVNGTMNHSGILGGSGSLVVSGIMNWTAGSLNVNLTITSGATLTVSTANGKTMGFSKTLLNQGTINWTGGVFDFFGATIQNENVFNVSADTYISNNGGSSLLNNTVSGTITKTGVGTWRIDIPVTNAGTININSGILNFTSTSSTHTGVINAASGSTFQNSGNFTDGGTINISSATFTNSSGTFTQNSLISFTGTVTVNNAGTWNVNVAQALSTTATMNHSGILGGSGSLVVSGIMNWTAGSLNVNLTITSGATLTVSTANGKTMGFSKTLLNQGTINWTGGVFDFFGATIQNENVFNVSADTYISNNGGSSLLNNTVSGTITKTGVGTWRIDIPVTNAGTININSGILNFTSTSSTHTGVINAASGSTFQNSGNFTDGGTINISSATFTNSSGTFTQNSLISFTGTVTVNNAGTWNVNVAQALSTTATMNHSGILGGSGSLVVSGIMNWTAGSLNVNLTITSGATLTVSTANGKTMGFSKTLLNQGTINWTGGVFDFFGATIQNENVFNVSADTYISNNGGSSLLNNTVSGTITKTGVGTWRIDIPVTNAGTININSGILNFTSTSSTHTGVINAASGSTFQNSGNFTDGGTINISSATFTNSSGTFTQNSLISFTGTVTVNNAGTWNVNVAQALSTTATMNHSGILGGSGSLVVSGIMNWTAGSLNVNLTITSGATLTVSTANGKTMGFSKTLLNQGTINWTGGVFDFFGATIQNENVFNVSADTYISNNGGSSLLNNTVSGTITKTGVGTWRIDIPVTNAGTININSGILNFTSTSSTHTGVINAASGSTFQNSGNFTDGGTINISSATFTNSSGTFTQNSLISFTGTVTVNNAGTWNVNVAQALSTTATMNHSGILGGSGSLVVSGIMNWTAGSLNVNLTITSGATLTVSTANGKTMGFSKTLLNQGTINWTGGVFDFFGATIQNENVFNVSADTYISNNGGSSLLNNTVSGTITKTGVGTWRIDIPVTNAGVFKGIGTLNFTNTLTNNGTIAPGLSPGILTVDGIQPFSANSTLSIEIAGNGGEGQPTGHDQLKRASDLALNGNLTVVETGTVPGGDYTILTLTLGSITGTFSSTNLPANYSVIYNSNNVVVRKGTLSTWYRDFDGDGFGDPNNSTQAAQQPAGYVANNTDCNDGSASINPNTIWYLDADNDNYYTGSGVTQCASPGAGYKMSGLTGGGDCNDNNVNIHPGATELCDGVDNDCDGQVDEGVKTTFYQDADGDGFGNPAVTQQACSVPQGYVANNTDCNDNNVNVHPGATEVCNGVDDDCDGQIDEGAQPVTWYQDLDGDGYGNAAVSQSSCTQPNGYVLNNTDCNDNNINVHPGATEVCNGIDDDCDGQTDEGVKTTFYQDLDGDGFGNAAVTQQACSVPNGYVANNNDCNDGNAAINPNTIWYLDADNDNYYTGSGITQCTSPGAGYKMSGLTGGGDCNDNNVNIHPGATEICNNADDDCDGQIDEGAQPVNWYQDLDGDGFGNAAVSQSSCTQPNGYVLNNTDCNDNNTNVHPGATEVCNGIDDDCDGQTDEGVTTTFYQDVDGDGFGNAAVTQQACSVPPGYVANSTDCNDGNAVINPNTIWYLDADNDNYYTGSGVTQCASPGAGYKMSGLLGSGDCNDNNVSIHPGATEICNNVDDDCDGQVDEGVKATFYQDADGDGFGNAAVTQQACSVPPGYVANSNDCNDGNAAINPNTIWYLDTDNDNYYTGSGVTQCASPGVGYKMSGLLGGSDCNDNNINIHPGAVEICNNIDDDCDGQIDEGAQPVNWYQDLDGDGYGNAAVSQSSCTQPNGYVLNNTDCNDNNVNVHPGATEVCNGIDDDCDGQVDEGVKTTFYQDADGDGFGNAAVTQQACSVPQGYVTNNTDCNDGNVALNPNTIWYLDADNDNYYTGSGVAQCVSPGLGYKMSGLTGGGDCNDNNINVHPGATEVCNGIDDDCDGQTDEGVTTTFYRDNDGDGFGNPAVTQQACSAPQGYVSNGTDCNDNNLNVHPGAIEVCGNSIDDDCNGQTDEGCQPNPDNDGDGYTVVQGDCNDNNAAIHPGATEICGNNIDDDCNGYTDENCLQGLPVLSSRTYPVKEGDAGITFVEVEVKLGHPARVPLQFNYATANEDAVAGLDYVGTNGVLIIPAGGVSGIIRVGIIGDRLGESIESFNLNFSNPINVILPKDAQVRIMILDDDKGNKNQKAEMDNSLTEAQPVFKIPNMVRRNNVWTIPGIERIENEVMVVNAMGQLIFKASNYKNSVSIGNVATGIYFYRIKVIEKDNSGKYFTGRLLITE